MKQTLKRTLALLMTVCMLMGLMPTAAFADPGDNTPAVNAKQPTITADVKYTTLDRKEAIVTLQWSVVQPDPCNVIFLVDTSTQGKASFTQFKQMILNDGVNMLPSNDEETVHDLQMIGYQQTETVSDPFSTREGLTTALTKISSGAGAGTANAAKALQAAAEQVDAIENDNTTVVFWVLGSSFGSSSNEEVGAALENLSEKLKEKNGSLITWQCGCETPNALLEQYAARYTPAGATDEVTAAYARTNSVLYCRDMTESLGNVLEDHYTDTDFPLTPGEGQQPMLLDADYTAGSGDELSVTVEGGKAEVTLTRVSTRTPLTLELTLNAENVEGKADSIFDPATMAAPRTGIFDEKQNSTISLPDVCVDRSQYKITYDPGDGTGSLGGSDEGMPGQALTLRFPDGMYKDGYGFGGWKSSVDGSVYAAGDFFTVPEQNVTMTALWGKTELELELGEVVEADALSNNMSGKATISDLLNFQDVTLSDGTPFDMSQVRSVQVVDAYVPYQVASTSDDPNKVTVTDTSLGALYARHVGVTTSNHVVAYLKQAEDGNGYDLIIAGPGGVTAPANMNNWMYVQNDEEGNPLFTNNIQKIDLTGLDTSKTTNMAGMFRDCGKVTELNLGDKFDTSSVTNMGGMFYNCSSLAALTFGEKFDTSSVTSMGAMLYNCKALKELDLSGFDTSEVRSFESFLCGCTSLETLTLGGGFVFTNCSSIINAFRGCKSLKELNLENVGDTNKLTNMGYAFNGCSNLKTLKLGSNFDTSNVTFMGGTFAGCTSLTELDLGNKFDTSQVSSMGSMFNGCSSLQTLKVGDHFVTDKVTNMANMFMGCSSLEDLSFVETFNTSNVTDMSNMFYNCSSLKALPLGTGFNTANVTNMMGMFRNCSSLTELDLGDSFDTSSCENTQYMFLECAALTTLHLGNNFNMEKVTTAGHMFYHCGGLRTIEGSLQFGETNACNSMDAMFSGCEQLPEIPFLFENDAPRFDSLNTMRSAFEHCSSLTRIDLGGWVLPNLTNTVVMFNGCSGLEYIDLSWSDIQATQDYTYNGMFVRVPKDATLEIGRAPGDSDYFMKAVMEEFKKAGCTNITVGGQPLPDATTLTLAEGTDGEENAAANTVTPNDVTNPDVTTPDATTPDGTIGDVTNPDVTTPDATTPDGTTGDATNPDGTTPDGTTGDATTGDVTTPDGTNPGGTTPDGTTPDGTTPDGTNPDGTNPDGTTPDATTPDGTTPDGTNPGAANPDAAALSDNAGDNAGDNAAGGTAPSLGVPFSALRMTTGIHRAPGDSDSALVVHADRTPPESKFSYLIHVKYVGDAGAKSGEIQLTFPIPEDVRVLTEGELPAEKEVISWTEAPVDSTDEKTSKPGCGMVVTNPAYDEKTNTLTATFSGLHVGCEFQVSIWCTNEYKAYDQDGGYAYWDGIAYSQSTGGSAASNYYRLWDKLNDQDPTPPTPTEHTLRYVFSGQVPPDAVLPASELHKKDKSVTTAAATTAYQGYTFTGWTYTDGTETKTVAPGGTLTMPDEDLVLTGTWTRDSVDRKLVTVQYFGLQEKPDTATQTYSVPVGETASILPLPASERLYNATAWEPTLQIKDDTGELQEVELEGTGGVYTGRYGGTEYTIPTTGTLDTEQFLAVAGNSDIAAQISYTAQWEPRTGTISFDANGGSGSMADVKGTCEATGNLPECAFTGQENYSFAGWADRPTGPVRYTAESTVSEVIRKYFTDEKTPITLYAVWTYTDPEKPKETVDVSPADVVIYMGGKGENKAVNDQGAIVSTTGLPEVGFLVTLPDVLTADYPDITVTNLRLQYTDDAGNLSVWKFTPYGAGDHAIYRIEPDGGTQKRPVRMKFTNAESEIITDDNFDVSENLNQTLTMEVYGEGIAAGEVTVKGTEEYENVIYKVSSGTATVTVRGTSDKAKFVDVENEMPPDPEEGGIALAETGTVYTINDSPVQVSREAKIQLLVDNILETNNVEDKTNTDLLTDKGNQVLNAEGLLRNGQRVYTFYHLDLVDHSNGNVWVTPNKPVTVMLPAENIPANANVLVLHYTDVQRDTDSTEIAKVIAKSNVECIRPKVANGYVEFTMNSFSPVAVVWQMPAEGGSESGGGSAAATPAATATPAPEGAAAPAAGQPGAAVTLPQTGDDSNPILWVVLCGAAFAGLVVLVVLRKKRR